MITDLFLFLIPKGFPGGSVVKNLPAMQETQVQFLGQEDPLEQGMAGCPLQYSWLSDPMDRGAWQAAVYKVTKSQTWLSDFQSYYFYKREWNGAGPCPPPPTPHHALCLLSMKNLSQKISLIREVRNAETKENSQRRLNNDDVVTRHSQGPSVLSQGL